MPGFDFNTLMRQVRQMQQQAEKKREELAEKYRFEGKAADGRVVATVNGIRELVSVKIDKDTVDLSDLSMLEDLVVAAVNQALAEAKKKESEEMAKVAGGMKIPGLSM